MTRLAAFALALLFAGSTAGAEWLLCAGSDRSSAARHACCAEMQMAVTADLAASCCLLSEQTRERVPVEAGPGHLGRVNAVEPVVLHGDARPLHRVSARASTLHTPSIPIYLQQRSLLI